MPRFIHKSLPQGGYGIFDTSKNRWKTNANGVLVFSTESRAIVAAQGYNRIEADTVSRRCFGKPSLYKGT